MKTFDITCSNLVVGETYLQKQEENYYLTKILEHGRECFINLNTMEYGCLGSGHHYSFLSRVATENQKGWLEMCIHLGECIPFEDFLTIKEFNSNT